MKQTLIILLAAIIGFIFGKSGFIGSKEKPTKIISKTDTIKIKEYVDRIGTTHAKIEDKGIADIKEAPIVEGYKTYVIDTLAPALKIAANKIQELTRINAKLQGELIASRKTTNEQGEIVREYESKYFKATTINDSLKYEYNAILDVVAYKDKSWLLGKEKRFVDISSPDKNLKINGVQRFRKEVPEFRTKYWIGLEQGVLIAPNFGHFNTGFKFRFNPDGFISPSI
jgi:hypothetical protein